MPRILPALQIDPPHTCVIPLQTADTQNLMMSAQHVNHNVNCMHMHWKIVLLLRQPNLIGHGSQARATAGCRPAERAYAKSSETCFSWVLNSDTDSGDDDRTATAMLATTHKPAISRDAMSADVHDLCPDNAEFGRMEVYTPHWDISWTIDCLVCSRPSLACLDS